MSANRLLQAQPSTNGHAVAGSPSPRGANGEHVGASETPRGPAPHPRPLSPEGRGEKDAPSPVGGNGNGAASTADPSRDAGGRFAKGNPGGHGNPFARQVAAIRKELLDALTPEKMKTVCNALIDKASSGDVPAIKVLFSYTIGKPGPAPDPDQLDEQEWVRFKAQAPMLAEMPSVLGSVSPEMPLDVVRTARPAMTREKSGMLANVLAMPPRESSALFDRMDSLPPAKLAAELKKLAKSKPGRTPSPGGSNGGDGARAKKHK